MMHHLDTDDMKLIDEVLTLHLRGLLAEIAAADSSDYKADLRKRYDRIDELRRRLISPPMTASGVAHP